MTYWIVDGQKLTNEQYEELQRQKRLEKQKIQEESDRLSRQLNLAYAALKEHLARNPDVSQEITDERALEQQIYYNLRQNLQRADQAPRCVFIREDGTVCKSPRLKNDIHCYAHYQMRHARAENLWLPALTDANAIQTAVMMVQRALIDDEISEKKAGMLLYSIQIAAANVGKTTFGQADKEMVTEIRLEDDVMKEHREKMEKLKRIEEAKNLPLKNTEDTDEEALNSQQSAVSQNLFTAKSTEDAKENGGLPRMDADERGSEKQNLPLITTENTDLKGTTAEGASTPGSQNRAVPGTPGCATRALWDPEVYANRGQIAETRANLG